MVEEHTSFGMNIIEIINPSKIQIQKVFACSFPSAGDRSNIILGVPRSNHKEQAKFKKNVIKKKNPW